MIQVLGGKNEGTDREVQKMFNEELEDLRNKKTKMYSTISEMNIPKRNQQQDNRSRRVNK